LIDRNLRRPIWLTEDQRALLVVAIEITYPALSDPETFAEIMQQLKDIDDAGLTVPGHMIKAMITGLHMPTDIRPVYISTAEIELLESHGNMPKTFLRLLTHDSVAHHRSRRKPAEIIEEPLPKKRGRKPKPKNI
jgi:hypothetical protein